jgi:hypothetical protein
MRDRVGERSAKTRCRISNSPTDHQSTIDAGSAQPAAPRRDPAQRQVLLADKEYRFSMPQAVFEDAERFLQKLLRAPHVLAGSAPDGPTAASAR